MATPDTYRVTITRTLDSGRKQEVYDRNLPEMDLNKIIKTLNELIREER